MGKNKTTGRAITGGLFWTFGERVSAQLISTLVTIVLARVLDPDHYGIISLVTVFISFCNVFVTSGFGNALVREKEIRDIDYSTAFCISFLMSLALYAILFFTAPWISSFYRMPVLTPVIRVMALRLPIASVNAIQQAHVQRQMAFKRFFMATLFGTILSGVVGVALALMGAGVWALVAQYLTNTTVDTLVLLVVDKWKPSLRCSREAAKRIYSFGWKVLVSELIASLSNDIRSLIVGKVFGPSDLAFYDQGKKYPSIMINNLNIAINKVMLPAYSNTQDNLVELKNMLRKSIQIGMFLLAPIMVGFSATADHFVSVVLTDKWLPCVPFIPIFCLYFLTRPVETSCQQAILSIGRSDITLRIMIMVNVVTLSSILFAAFVLRSVFMIALGSLLTTAVSLGSFMFFTNKLMDYRLKEQLNDILPSFLASLFMGVVVYLIGRLAVQQVVLLLIQIAAGAAMYVLLAHLLHLPAYVYAMQVLKKMLHRG